MQLPLTSARLATVLLMLAAAVPTAAEARTASLGKWVECSAEVHGIEIALRETLSPADGTSVQVGTSITFSGQASTALTFAVASSPELLAHPDIASGPGSAQPGGSPSDTTYTFTSAAAGAAPRTIYWSASFSTGGLPSCEGEEAQTVSSATRTLTVLPAPAPPQTPPQQTTPPPPSSPLSVEIEAVSKLTLAHPLLAYRLHCSASCSGTTSVHAFALHRHHGRTEPEPALDVASKPVSIADSGGGELKLTHRYARGALRLIHKLIAAGDKVELQISVISGAARAQRVIWLRL